MINAVQVESSPLSCVKVCSIPDIVCKMHISDFVMCGWCGWTKITRTGIYYIVVGVLLACKGTCMENHCTVVCRTVVILIVAVGLTIKCLWFCGLITPLTFFSCFLHFRPHQYYRLQIITATSKEDLLCTN